jgi:hypothetical protein
MKRDPETYSVTLTVTQAMDLTWRANANVYSPNSLGFARFRWSWEPGELDQELLSDIVCGLGAVASELLLTRWGSQSRLPL